MGDTKIEWTDKTWSPLRARVKDDAAAIARAKGYTSLIKIAERMSGHVGPHCERVSHGCDNCYSDTNNGRCLPSNGTGLPFDRRSRDLIDPIVDEHILTQPLHWKKPQRIFVENQSDLFGEWVSDEAIDRVFAVMALCPHHTHQVLTKRPERMLTHINERPYSFIHRAIKTLSPGVGAVEFMEMAGRRRLAPELRWPLSNVWLGVSVEARTNKARIELLRQTPAAVRFISIEPLLEDIGELDLRGIHWVIVGGESGPGARPMHPDWVRSIRDQCAASGVAFFFKQWGEWTPENTSARRKIRLTWKGRNGSDLSNAADGGDVWMSRIGKHLTGAMLDGRAWREFPEVRA